jgi:hypothetical protein
MKNTNQQNEKTSSKLEVLITKLDNNLKEGVQLMKRYKSFIDCQDNLRQKNGGINTEPFDIITLNVSGTEMFARRDTLTIVRGSRLEAIFSGRWENKLLRDAKGRVFIDMDPLIFRKILEYLHMLKLLAKNGGTDIILDLPHVSPELKPSFDQYMNYFALNKGETYTTNQQMFTSKDQMKEVMSNTKSELDKMEKKLEEEESFIAYFIKGIHDKQEGIYHKTDDSIVSEEMDDWTMDKTPSIAKTLSDSEFGIMNLYVNGEIIAVKHSTLCFDLESKLARDFSNEIWVEEHSIITEDGKACILVELPAYAFKYMLHHLQRIRIAKEDQGGTMYQPSSYQCVTPSSSNVNPLFNRGYLKKVLVNYFSAEHEMVKSISYIESNIIENTNDEIQIKDWLESVDKVSKPKLLYRASRDGWDGTDFHRQCDNKGPILTIVKSTGGYIFGGYSSTSWTSSQQYECSSNAFLFSLKCHHAGLNAVKMNLANNHVSSYSICCIAKDGPTFGRGFDLHISSNANTTMNSNSKVGHTYSLPSGVTDEYFLTGRNSFQVSEYEVFQM